MSIFKLKRTSFRTRQNVYGHILAGFSFMVLTLLTVKTLAPEINTSAVTQTAEQTVGPFTMSMSNDSVAETNITPTGKQVAYPIENNLSITNTCDAGATISMTTNSTTSNSLVRTGSDSLTKEIKATTTTSLDDNSWGYALKDSSTYYAVPKKGDAPATIYDDSVAQATALPISVKFGVKVDNSMPSGTYTNDVVYTMTPKAGCLKYTITWDMDGGTKKSGATYPTSLGWGDTVNLSTLTPTRDGYTFAGWTSTPTGSSSGSSNYTGTEAAANLNSANAKSVTVKAKWNLIQAVWNFDYTGGEQTFSAPQTGYYKLEVWGAQGGDASDSNGGHGGYSTGIISLSSSAILYVYVGGQGTTLTVSDLSVSTPTPCKNGGFNGGGSVCVDRDGNSGSGGGGTDIRISGTSLYQRVIVAGGGGGGDFYNSTSSYKRADDAYGGGTSGQDGDIRYAGSTAARGGNQISGGRGGNHGSTWTYCDPGGFGQGSNGYSKWQGGGSIPYGRNGTSSGGGGGWYGGGAGSFGSGGGGSGWVYTASTYSYWAANSVEGKSGKWLLNSDYYLINASTVNGGTIFKSPSGSNETGHSGNGYARISYLGTSF